MPERRRNVPRAPFVVTVAVAAGFAACGGHAVDDTDNSGGAAGVGGGSSGSGGGIDRWDGDHGRQRRWIDRWDGDHRRQRRNLRRRSGRHRNGGSFRRRRRRRRGRMPDRDARKWHTLCHSGRHLQLPGNGSVLPSDASPLHQRSLVDRHPDLQSAGPPAVSDQRPGARQLVWLAASVRQSAGA